jgi:hypothetical protein
MDNHALAGIRIRVTRTYGTYLDGRSNIPEGSVGTIMSNGVSMGTYITDGFTCNFEGYDGDYTIMLEDIEILTPGIKLSRYKGHKSLLTLERE